MAAASSWRSGSLPSTLRSPALPTSVSTWPDSVTPRMSTPTPCSSSKARRQAVAPAPPVVIRVPSMSKRTASISASLIARGPRRPIAADQCVGRGVVRERRLLGRLQLRDDPLRELLAQLHAPLVEGVDLPDRPLGEDAVFVERDQPPQGRGVEPLGEDRVGWPSALEGSVRDHRLGVALFADLIRGLAEGERL